MKETIEIYVEPFLSFTVDVYDICYEPAETSNIWEASSDWDLQDHLEYCYDVVSATEHLDAEYYGAAEETPISTEEYEQLLKQQKSFIVASAATACSSRGLSVRNRASSVKGG